MTEQITYDTLVDPAEPIEKSVISGMMQSYLKELSPYTGQKARGDGRYAYPFIEGYWHEPERHAFLVRNAKNVVGFALVREVPGGTTMAEFFIKPEHRHRGHGKVAAQEIFRRYPGKWAVRQQLTNADAQAFWRRVISDIDPKYAERIETTTSGRSGTVQRFVVP